MSINLSQAIVNEILEKIHDEYDSGNEIIKELKQMETVSFEENCMDQQFMDTKAEEKRLSDQNDLKILKRRKKDEEEEVNRHTEKTGGETGPENLKSEVKRKWEISKTHSSHKRSATNASLRSGFKELPNRLKKHFPKDHVVLQVKPDGTCGVACGAAHIFAQASKSRQFRREINKHMVANWEYYKNKVIFPYDRQVGVGGKHVKFTNSLDFQNFLQTQDADSLWTDSEEIQAMCNMYQMPATVVKVSGGEDDHPSVAQVGPDGDIKEIGLSNTTLVKPGNVPKMHLLLEGAHYSLVVPRTSMTEKHAVHPEPEESDKGYEAEGDEEDEEGEVTTTIKSAEDKLHDLQNEYEALKAMYVKVVKENKKLKANTNVTTDNPATSDKESDATDEETLTNSKSKGFKRTTPQNQSEKKLSCPICKISFRKENELRKHMTCHNKDGDWTCNDCSFQTNMEDKLRDHKIRAHEPNEVFQKTMKHGARNSGGSTCNLCTKDFIYKIDLNKHIAKEHKTYKQCRNLGSCSYLPRCPYNHNEYPPGTQICYECGDTFKTLHELMRHR